MESILEKQANSGKGLGGFAIVADDLTGACDAAIPFAGHAERVSVDLSGDLSYGNCVCAVSTDTRDLPEADADRRLREVVRGLPAGANVFKKIDSAFRGNTVAEIVTAVKSFDRELAVLAPAYPAMGRTMEAGTVRICDVDGNRDLDLARALEARLCSPQLLRSSLRWEDLSAQMHAALRGGAKVVLCDAVEQSHLEAVVAAASSLRIPVLWIGSGGLAHALAGCLPTQQQSSLQTLSREGHALFFIGSDHAATQGQVEHLCIHADLTPVECHNEAQEADRALLLRIPRNASEVVVRNAVSRVSPADTSVLFMTGGDTAKLVCSALGIRSLRLVCEFARGVPLCIAEGGAFDGATVILKSGAFGARDLMCQVFESFAKKEKVRAS